MRLPPATDGRPVVGGGGHGVNVHVRGSVLVEYLGADVADVTKPDDDSGRLSG